MFRVCSISTCATVLFTWGNTTQTVPAGNYYLQVENTSSATDGAAVATTLTIDNEDSTTWTLTTDANLKLVFATNNISAGNFGGVAGANTDCANAATAAGLPGTYKAWLAVTTGTDDPATTFTRSTGHYVLVDYSTVIANNWTGLTSGTLLHGITLNENGANMGNPLTWTNVATTGKATSSGSSATANCSGWTTTTGGGDVGAGANTDSNWTASGTNFSCASNLGLYCFQQ
jgi:hypothetical protein